MVQDERETRLMFYFLLAYYFVSLLVFLWQKVREADYEDQFKSVSNP